MNVHDEVNDNEVLRAVSDSLSGIPMPGPPDVEAIMARGRARRRRRLIPGVTGALALAAGAALAMTTLLPSGFQPSHPARAQLAAWTVAKQGDGGIRITIRELRDPAGLQRTLRADGAPVSVTFIGQPNPACQPYSFSGSQSQHRLSWTAWRRRSPVTITPWSSTPWPSRPALACISPPASTTESTYKQAPR